MTILARLPVKSLFRFKCVSKEFHIFINADDDDDKGYHLIDHWSCHFYSVHHPKTYDEYFRFKLPSDMSKLLHVNSCNGLSGLFGRPNIVVLWKPLIRKFLMLPKPSVVPDRIGIFELAQVTGSGLIDETTITRW